MDGVLFAVEALVVIGAIVMGTRSSGVGLGIWGGVGVAVLVFVFGLEPGSPPVDAILIILTVILIACIIGMAIEARINSRKGDNGMRRRMTDRKDVLPAPDRNCRRYMQDWETHAPQATRRKV